MAVGSDRVQVLKYEESSKGGDAADDSMGIPAEIEPQEDAIETAGVFFQDATNRDEAVVVDRDEDDLRFKDVLNPVPVSLSDLLATSGLTPTTHRAVDQLVHEIAEDSYDEFIYSGIKLTNFTTWTDSGKTVKIREQIYTYTGNKVTTIVTKQYNGVGAVITGETMTEVFTYSGNTVDDVTRTMS